MSCCLSPIEYFIEYVDYQKSLDPGITMSDVLNSGHIFPNTVNMCCPNYCSAVYMLIGQGTSALQDYRDNGPGFNFGNCCVNVYSLFNNFIELSSNYLENFPPDNSGLYISYNACCNTNTNIECVNKLLEHTNSTSLKEWFYEFVTSSSKGLFEYNLINGKFGFCELVDILKTKSSAIAEEYMLAILNEGLVISCKPNGTFVGSLQTYIDNYGSSGPAE